MAEYIEREAVLAKQFDCNYLSDAAPLMVVDVEDIEAVPAADVVEVKRGRWIGTHDGWYYSYSCSECGAEALTKEETMHDQVCSPFCPYCGADMREADDAN